ncbi:ABC transporter permease subunit [Truepera radiovictrix]|uniref:ABC transporter permease subunit n=1 Tax=Truepera radiovictrix TaxID=332249 RepID=UPI001FE0EA35|nr:ABC transporter permease subunit [Truepera radiovictrix]WMT56505.1 ABC transporter permease subunit [Truepera radiovictrix]
MKQSERAFRSFPSAPSSPGSFAGIPYYVRIARGSALAMRESEFVQAARAAGAPTWWILARHVLPNALSPLVWRRLWTSAL